MSDLNVLISGSGIAGSVFASWLLRAHPTAKITIVERDPTLRLTGASVDIRSSAVDIIKWMGAEKAIRDQTTREEGMQAVDENGREIATFRATGRTDVQSFTSEYEIFRGALAKIFIDPIVDKVNLIFNEYVETYEQRDEKVIVTFAKSNEIKEYDLLVAADGLSSKIRGTMLNTKPREQIYGEGTHAAYFTIKKDLLRGDLLAKGLNAPGGRLIFVRPDPNPEGRTRGNLIVITTKGQLETRKRLDQALREGNESYMELMEELFHGIGWLTPEILKGMRESDDFYASIFGQVRSPKIHDGRVVLLGDAGYATPGIGTSLAIIGGYVLAGELLSHPGDIKEALARYEGILLPFAKSQQGGTDLFQYVNPQTWWGIWIRNSILRVIVWTKIDKMAMFAARVMGFAEKRPAMPEYPWPEKTV
ncbi:MAG: hypothetical protein L6R41_000915 [Letrouitia leprolyta]|nr:MAG: hypothetical protein L6R41_000915 [Letrouitia leprolyta]